MRELKNNKEVIDKLGILIQGLELLNIANANNILDYTVFEQFLPLIDENKEILDKYKEIKK